MSRTLRKLFPAFTLVLFCFVAYFPALRGQFIWDDNGHLLDYVELFNLTGLWKIWTHPGFVQQYYPMTYTVFALQYRLWGLIPTGYHLVNLALHLANALLVGILLKRLGLRYAALSAALFAFHPVAVESVAWISELKNVLSTFFYLLSAMCYLSFAIPGFVSAELRRSSRWNGPALYAAAFLLFLAAITSKTVACSLPVALLLIVGWKTRAIPRKDAVRLIPFFMAGLLGGQTVSWLEQHSIGAVGPEWQLSVAQRVLLASKAIWFYLGKVIYPYPLSFNYPRWVLDPSQVSLYLYPLALILGMVVLARIRTQSRSGVSAALAIYAVTLFPALGFFSFYPMRFSYVADHFQYLALIPIFALLGQGLGILLDTHVSSVWVRRSLLGLGGFTLLICTHLRAYAFYDNESLWRDTLIHNRESPLAHSGLGSVLLSRGDRQEARLHFLEALRLDPSHVEARLNIAGLDLDTGHPDAAIAAYRELLQKDRGPLHNKRLAPSLYYSLARAYTQQGRLLDAHRELLTMMEALPGLYEGLPYGETKKIYFMEAKARDQIASWFASHGQKEEAILQLREALRIQPNAAPLHLHLALALQANGDLSGAIVEYERALALDGNSVQAQRNLADLQARGSKAPSRLPVPVSPR